MGIIAKFNEHELSITRMKELLSIAKDVKSQIQNVIEKNEEVEYYERLSALCFLFAKTILDNGDCDKNYAFFQSLLPPYRYYKNGTPCEDGSYCFPVDKADTNLSRGFYKYRLIWLEELITLLETKI